MEMIWIQKLPYKGSFYDKISAQSSTLSRKQDLPVCLSYDKVADNWNGSTKKKSNHTKTLFGVVS
jgi:hypothetical protein